MTSRKAIQIVNLSWPRDVMWRYTFVSTLVQVWPVAWWYQAITRTNIYLLSKASRGIQLGAISQEVVINLIRHRRLKKLNSNPVATNGFPYN